MLLPVALMAGLSANELHGQPIIYVNQVAAGANNGTSWVDAWDDLQDALGHATDGTRIWVAAGTYRPGTSRSATFRLLDGVEIDGGFAGIEDPRTFDLSRRDFITNETILDGRIGADTDADNSYHVVTGSGTDASAVLDGFTIAGANADGATALWQDVGGGLLNIDGSPTIRHCLFLRNHAGWGGAVYNRGPGGLTLVNCRFIGNTASMDGGAIHSVGTGTEITTPVVVNGLFSGNQSLGGDGGAVFNTIGSRMTAINGTFSRNVARGDGGGIYHEYGLMVLMNCILWGNRDRGPMDQSSQLGGGLPTVRYCCVQGLTAPLVGCQNIGADPSFVSATGPDGVVGTVDDNLRLAAGSPGIDAGTNETPVDIGPVDLDGNPRIVDDPMTPDTGDPPTAPAIVDMGTYEYQEPCEVDSDCDDGDPCTDDQCQWPPGRCLHTPVDCDDRVFCNGLEICVDGGCRAGTRPDCDDGVTCTIDTCNEAADSCDHVADHSRCDNGLRCDGIETCHRLNGCQTGVPLDCHDGVDCTTDRCDEAAGSCVHTPVDAVCDDGLYCNGMETCDVQGGCRPGIEPCEPPLACDEATDACAECVGDADCDDGVFCNGFDKCVDGQCRPGNDPCPQRRCDETAQECMDCLTPAECDDGNACTVDRCDAGNCLSAPVADETPCADGLFCNGDEVCVDGTCAEGTTPCDEGETCDELADECRPRIQCQTHDDCEDGNLCTDDTCARGMCERTPNTASCDDGNPCTADDRCAGGVCAGTPIPGCGQPPTPPPPVQTTDADGDGIHDPNDRCPRTPLAEPADAAGCSCSQLDADGDGVNNCQDVCPADPGKSDPGQCGCGLADTDSDGDGVADCRDPCPDDGAKTDPGTCGCGVPDRDSDNDGTLDCRDACPDTLRGSPVGSDGCNVVPPTGKTGRPARAEATPEPFGDDGRAEADLGPDTAIDPETDPDAYPSDTPVVDQLASSSARRSCGACGALGIVSWSLLVVGLLGLRHRATGFRAWG